MITYKEFTRQFKLQTESLAYQKQFELAVSICTKLFFDYQKFSEDNNWGEPNLLLDTIRFIEQCKDLQIDVALSRNKISQIEAVTPDTEDFGDAIYALNCCVAVCRTLEFLADHKAEHIYSVGICLTDTIDFKIQEDDELTETEIDNNSDMIQARKFLLEMSR
jgi:uncharacterized protein